MRRVAEGERVLLRDFRLHARSVLRFEGVVRARREERLGAEKRRASAMLWTHEGPKRSERRSEGGVKRLWELVSIRTGGRGGEERGFSVRRAVFSRRRSSLNLPYFSKESSRTPSLPSAGCFQLARRAG